MGEQSPKKTSRLFLEAHKEIAPTFTSIVHAVLAKNPVQAKTLEPFLAQADAPYWQRAEQAALVIRDHLAGHEQGLDVAVNAYGKMCKEMLVEQLKFARTGHYSTSCASDAYDAVYSCEQHMLDYMYGLALSQFLWANHYEIYKFFLNFINSRPSIGNYLEIGAGHGLHLLQALQAWPTVAASVVDISPASIRICRDLVDRHLGNASCQFMVQDVLEYDGGPFDCIVIGEVLEHVDNPLAIIQKLTRLLTAEGRLFVTTCARCPAVDHVYLYQDAAEIEQHLIQGGLRIESRLALPIHNMPRSADGDTRPGINYSAVCMRAA